MLQMLVKISKQCEDIKAEFHAYREASQQETRETNCKLEAMTKLVNKQWEIIQELRDKNKTINVELSECIVDHIQQNELLNTVEISGVDVSSDEEIVDAVLKIAATVNVPLTKKQIFSTRRLKNKKLSVTFHEREKCGELISASFKNKIRNPLQTNKTCATERVFISNSLTTKNQRIYKQLRDMRKKNCIDKIGFFNGVFAVYQSRKGHPFYIHNSEQLKEITNSA
jgi:hypothetical protein